MIVQNALKIYLQGFNLNNLEKMSVGCLLKESGLRKKLPVKASKTITLSHLSGNVPNLLHRTPREINSIKMCLRVSKVILYIHSK